MPFSPPFTVGRALRVTRVVLINEVFRRKIRECALWLHDGEIFEVRG